MLSIVWLNLKVKTTFSFKSFLYYQNVSSCQNGSYVQFTVSYFLPVIIYYLDLRIIIDLLTEETEYQHSIYGDDDNVLFLYVEITIFRKSRSLWTISKLGCNLHAFPAFCRYNNKSLFVWWFFFWSNDQFAIWVMCNDCRVKTLCLRLRLNGIN